MAVTNSITLDDLKALEEAYFKGIRRVEYNDRRVEYRSLQEMKQIIDEARLCLGLKPDGRGLRRVATTKKGL